MSFRLLPAVVLLLGSSTVARAADPPVGMTWASDERSAPNPGPRWNSRLARGSERSLCGDPATDCSELAIVVRNDSAWPLSCLGAIRFAQPNENRIADAHSTAGAMATPDAYTTILRTWAPVGMNASSFDIQCLLPPPVPPPPNSGTVCKVKFAKPVVVDDYYPPSEREAKHQGKVYLEFTLTESPGTPADVHVYQSSSFPELDAAAARILRDSRLTTNCLNGKTRLAITFALPKVSGDGTTMRVPAFSLALSSR